MPKRGARDDRAHGPRGLAPDLQPVLSLQQPPAEPGQQGAHEDDQHSRDDLERAPVLPQQVADRARARAEGREDETEAEHEPGGGDRDAPVWSPRSENDTPDTYDR